MMRLYNGLDGLGIVLVIEVLYNNPRFCILRRDRSSDRPTDMMNYMSVNGQICADFRPEPFNERLRAQLLAKGLS